MKIRKFFSNLAASGGYIWGVALVIIVPVFFVTMGMTAHNLAQFPFMRVHPRYSGGEIVLTEPSDGVEWRIHRAVFDGLVSERSHGFIQIDAIYEDLPTRSIKHEVDYNQDGTSDFLLSIPANGESIPVITTKSAKVVGIESWTRTREGWIVRISLNGN